MTTQPQVMDARLLDPSVQAQLFQNMGQYTVSEDQELPTNYGLGQMRKKWEQRKWIELNLEGYAR